MAKNKKAGLGRGLNSLLAGMKRPPTCSCNARTSGGTRWDAGASIAEPTPAAPAPVVEREVIREEDLAPEDRETLDGEKYSTPKQYAKPTAATEPLSSRIAVKDVVAKTELIEEPDGVTIKSVTERPATPAARYMEEVNRPSALDARLMQREAAPAPQATVPAPQATLPPQLRLSLKLKPLELLNLPLKQHLIIWMRFLSNWCIRIRTSRVCISIRKSSTNWLSQLRKMACCSLSWFAKMLRL